MKQIKNIVEPQRLLLVWQSANRDFRKRVGVAILDKVGDDCALTYLDNDEVKEARDRGFDGYPSFKYQTKNSYQNVLETFTRRLPPESRSDYPEFLGNLHISPEAKISKFALLGYSEAKLPGDGFSIVHTFEEANAPFQILTEVCGFQYYVSSKMDLKVGDKVSFMEESENPVDSNALQIITNGKVIGYINRLQLNAFHKWLSNNTLIAEIERLNGSPENPKAMLFVEVE